MRSPSVVTILALFASGCFTPDPTNLDTDGTDATSAGTTTPSTSSDATTSDTTTGTTTASTSDATTTASTTASSTDDSTTGTETGTGSTGECDPSCEPGEFLWQVEDLANSFVTDMHFDDGSIYLCGNSAGATQVAGITLGGDGDSNVFVLRMAQDGSFDWGVSRGGVGEEYCVSLFVNAMGRLAIGGVYFGAGSIDGTALPDAGSDLGTFVTVLTVDDKTTEQVIPLDAPAAGDEATLSGPITMNGADDVMFAVQYETQVVFDGVTFDATGPFDSVYGRFDTAMGYRVPLTGNNAEHARGVVFAAGGVFLSGEFSTDMELDTTVTATEALDVFIARSNELGDDIAWSIVSHADGEERTVWSDVDAAGNLYVVGSFTEDMRLDGLDQTETAVEQDDVWLAKIAANGTPQWLASYGGLGPDVPRNIAVSDDGDIVISGEFSSSIDFGDGAHTLIGGDRDAFIAKFDTDGALLWSRAGGGAGTDRGLGVEIAPNGSVFASFSFFDDAQFGGDMIALGGNPFGAVIVKYAP